MNINVNPAPDTYMVFSWFGNRAVGKVPVRTNGLQEHFPPDNRNEDSKYHACRLANNVEFAVSAFPYHAKIARRIQITPK